MDRNDVLRRTTEIRSPDGQEADQRSAESGSRCDGRNGRCVDLVTNTSRGGPAAGEISASPDPFVSLLSSPPFSLSLSRSASSPSFLPFSSHLLSPDIFPTVSSSVFPAVFQPAAAVFHVNRRVTVLCSRTPDAFSPSSPPSLGPVGRCVCIPSTILFFFYITPSFLPSPVDVCTASVRPPRPPAL